MALLQRAYGEDLAPVFMLVVEGKDVTGDLSRLISRVEFESALDIADELLIEVVNPGFAFTTGDLPPDLVSHKAFQPGNEVELFMGYGRPDTFIGRAILARHLPRYPSNAVPTLEIYGHDKSFFMMNMEGEITGGKETRVRAAKESPESEKKEDSGQVYVDMNHDVIVRGIVTKWGLEPDVQEIKSNSMREVGEGLVQPKGMSDYEFLRALANINDFDFWIDWRRPDAPLEEGVAGPSRGGAWVLHWKEPERNQTPGYVFRYDEGDKGSLLEIELDYGIRDAITDIHVLAWDENYQTWVSTVLVENAMGPDPKWRVSSGRAGRRKQGEDATDDGAGETAEMITKSLTSSTKFRMAAGGISIDVIAGRPFASMDDAANWARRWFLRRKDHFTLARGITVGVEGLAKGQVHTLKGLGPRLSGDYFFHSVRHKITLDGSLPYTCEFIANRVIE